MLLRLHNIFAIVFDLMLWPFRGMNPLVGMAVVSLVSGVLFLMVYPYVSNQSAIRRTKDRIKAHLLELFLFKDDMVVTLRAQKSLFGYNLRYMGLNLAPIVVLIVPFVLLMVQLQYWYGLQPVAPGESVHLWATVSPDTPLARTPVSLEVDPGVTVETAAVRSADGVIGWRIRGDEEGLHPLILKLGDQAYKKTLVVSSSMARVSPVRHQGSLGDAFFYPGEPALPDSAGLSEIRVDYQTSTMDCFGLMLPWWLVFLILIMAFGFGLKGFFGVEI